MASRVYNINYMGWAVGQACGVGALYLENQYQNSKHG